MRSPILLLLTGTLAFAQISIEDYEPKSGLVVPQNPTPRARFPVIDIHNHQRNMTPERVDKLVGEMDQINLRLMVNLSGGFGQQLKDMVQSLKGKHPERFVVFANLDFSGIDDADWGAKAAAQLEQDVRNGAQGLKIFKNLGLDLNDSKGRRIPVDDPRFDPVWRACGRLKIPVLIHTGEPPQLFDPMDKFNERWIELKRYPGRGRPPEKYPTFDAVMSEQHRVFEKHRGTTFVNAHLGWYGGDLARLGKLLDKLPNMYTEIGAVVEELGRQPRFARKWFIQYQDRVLFGKDTWNAREYGTYYRLLETADEYFDHDRKHHGLWKVYGLDLPGEVLKKLYYKNALKILPGVSAAGYPK
jgi:uncharacterized protein